MGSNGRFLSGPILTCRTPGKAKPHRLMFGSGNGITCLVNRLSNAMAMLKCGGNALRRLRHVRTSGAHALKDTSVRLSPSNHFLCTSRQLASRNVSMFTMSGGSKLLAGVNFRPATTRPHGFTVAPGKRFVLITYHSDRIVRIFGLGGGAKVVISAGRSVGIKGPIYIRFTGWCTLKLAERLL